MAIQKFQVPADVLPLPWSDGKFYLRYRMITEDGAVTSDWSSVYDVDTLNNELGLGDYGGQIVQAEPYSIYINASPTNDSLKMLLEWDSLTVSQYLNVKFDLFVKWSYDTENPAYGEWVYAGTTSANSHYVTTNIDEVFGRATFAKVRLQIASQDNLISENLLIHETSEYIDISTTYVSDIDGGVI